MNIMVLFLYFFVYSFIGYIAEVIFVSFLNKKIVNRGFLCGPVCPIYGIGAILMVYLLQRYAHDYVALFVLGALIASVLEYLISYILEKIFHNKWWDYSENKFNLNGRVCLLNTFLFGVSSVLLIEILHPLMSKFMLLLSPKLVLIVFTILIVLFILDIIYSCIIAYNLRSRLIIVEELKNEKLSMIPNLLQSRITKRVNNLKLYPKRLVAAFPNLAKKYKVEFDYMKKLRKKNKNKKK